MRLSQVLLRDGQFKEAVGHITRLRLQDHFPPEAILRPLLDTNQHSLAASYVQEMPGTELLFMNMVEEKVRDSLPLWLVNLNLGRLIVDPAELSEPLTATHRLGSDLPRDFLKLTGKYAEQFHVELTEAEFPAICQASDLAALKWLAKSRQRDRLNDVARGVPPNVDNWDSLIDVLLEAHPALQLLYVRWLREQGDEAACDVCAARFSIPFVNYASVQPLPPLPLPLLTPQPKTRPPYSRPHDLSVTFVDTPQALLACREAVSQVAVVGIDCEWRTSIGRFRRDKLALFQLAAEGSVFLIDLHALSAADVVPFMVFLFSAETITKLGFQFDSDIKQLGRSYPGMGALAQLSSYVELADLDSQILKRARNRRRSPNEKRGLSTLARRYLHCTLDKRMQVSDWARRPLTPSQFEYSASDAYVLIDLYRRMTEVHLRVTTDPQVNWRDLFSDSSDDEGQQGVAEDSDNEESSENDDDGAQGDAGGSSSGGGAERPDTEGKDAAREKRGDHRTEDGQRDSKRYRPADQLEKKLVKQVEYYLSQKSLAKNEYFRRAMDPAGFVDLAVILQVHKVRNIMDGVPEAQVIAALQKSPIFEFSASTASLRLRTPGEGVEYIPWEFKKNLALSVGSSRALSPGVDAGATHLLPEAEGGGREPASVAVLVDSMMGKLGKKLRCCGVDTVIVAANQQGDIAAIAERTGRVVLTRGRGVTPMRARLPSSRVFHVTERDVPRQLLQVLTHFGVKVRKSDLFSRCPVCNANQFLPRTNEDVRSKHGFGGVPPGVVEQVSDFFECAGCGKLYWEGV